MNTKEIYKAGQAGVLNSLCKHLLVWYMKGLMTRDEFENRFIFAIWSFQKAREYLNETPTREIKAIVSDLEHDYSQLVARIPFNLDAAQEYLALANEYLVGVASMAGVSDEEYAAFVESHQ